MFDGMDLVDALEAALRECSPDGVTMSPAAFDMLDKAECFDGRADIRFIFRTCIRSGAFGRFASYGEGTEQSVRFLEHFVSHTGFKESLVEDVFSLYAKAIGWDERFLPIRVGDDEPECGCAENVAADNGVCEPEEVYGKIKDVEWHRLPVNDKVAVLNESITIDDSKAANFGATVERPYVVDIDVEGIRITATLRRITPMGGCQVQYALYDGDDRLLSVGTAATMSVFSPDVMPVQFVIPVENIPDDDCKPLRAHLFVC